MNEQDIKVFANLLVVTVLLLVMPLPFLFKGQIEDYLISHAIGRYDKVIDAIENYRRENGEYPSTLDDLAPDYLYSEPGIYMKYGTSLEYGPEPKSEYIWFGEYGPFNFELYGSHNGRFGQVLKYCPSQGNWCSSNRFTRIDDRWVWLYVED